MRGELSLDELRLEEEIRRRLARHGDSLKIIVELDHPVDVTRTLSDVFGIPPDRISTTTTSRKIVFSGGIVYHRGDLNANDLKSVRDLRFPKVVAGHLSLFNLVSPEVKGGELPEIVFGGVYVDNLKRIEPGETLRLPRLVGGDLFLSGLLSPEGVEFPEFVGSNVCLARLRSTEGLRLPNSVGGVVYYEQLPQDEVDRLRREYPHLKLKLILKNEMNS